MPELHKRTPVLGVLQDRGFKVALLTDGRMSGASGTRCRPPAAASGFLTGSTPTPGGWKRGSEWAFRTAADSALSRYAEGVGRELFANFRVTVTSAEAGAAAITVLPGSHSFAEAGSHARF